MKIETSKQNVKMMSYEGVKVAQEQFTFANCVSALSQLNSEYGCVTDEMRYIINTLLENGANSVIITSHIFSWSNYKQMKTSECVQYIAIREKEKYDEIGAEIVATGCIYWD